MVLRLYQTLSEILHGFDIGSCSVAFDGKQIWATTRSAYCLSRNINLVDISRLSTSFGFRMKKYFQRGFDIVFVSLDLVKFAKNWESMSTVVARKRSVQNADGISLGCFTLTTPKIDAEKNKIIIGNQYAIEIVSDTADSKIDYDWSDVSGTFALWAKNLAEWTLKIKPGPNNTPMVDSDIRVYWRFCNVPEEEHLVEHLAEHVEEPVAKDGEDVEEDQPDDELEEGQTKDKANMEKDEDSPDEEEDFDEMEYDENDRSDQKLSPSNPSVQTVRKMLSKVPWEQVYKAVSQALLQKAKFLVSNMKDKEIATNRFLWFFPLIPVEEWKNRLANAIDKNKVVDEILQEQCKFYKVFKKSFL